MAEEGIGGLAYSGKIMAPVSFTRNVAAVRDAIEKETGIYYDCCLINWYDDGECAVRDINLIFIIFFPIFVCLSTVQYLILYCFLSHHVIFATV